METMTAWLEQEFLGISLRDYGLTLFFVLLGFIARWVVGLFLNRARKLSENTANRYDDAIISALARPLGWAAVLTGIWAGIRMLPLPVEPFDVERFVNALIKSAYIVLAVWVLMNLTRRLTEVMLERAKKTDTVLDDQFIPIIGNSLRVFFIMIGVATILQEMGYSIASLLAGVGLGGAALALASKDTLANLFGSIVIFVDRPFTVGDWIELDGIEGTVEEVGLRVTRIRTFANSLITMPNSLLTTTAINNWSRMRKRRIKMTVGLTYDTTPDQMQQALESIRSLIREDERLHSDFFLVNFNSFGPYSLDIFIYCFTVTTVWGEFMQVQEDFMLEIMRRLKELGLDFAFPTSTVHLANMRAAGEMGVGKMAEGPGKEQ